MAKSLEEQLAEIEAEIAKIEAANTAYEKSKEYRDKLSTLKAREKTAGANREEAEAHEAKVETAVLRAARILHPTYHDKLHPDFISAIEKLTGVAYGQWKTIAQPGRTNGPEADPVATLIVKMKQEVLAKSPEWRKARKECMVAQEVASRAWRDLHDFESHRPMPDPWRPKEQARWIRERIAKRDAAKATTTADDKKEKAKILDTRNRVLAIIRGEGEFTW